MSVRAGIIDCLPPHGEMDSVRTSSWWILAAVVAIGVLWTILE